MVVTVKLIGELRRISGKNQLSIKCEESTSLKDLFNTIAQETPEFKTSLLSNQYDDSKTNALILVNGREISVLNGLETNLNDGDEIILIPVVHGG